MDQNLYAKEFVKQIKSKERVSPEDLLKLHVKHLFMSEICSPPSYYNGMARLWKHPHYGGSLLSPKSNTFISSNLMT